MIKIILNSTRLIIPFNKRACDLRIQNQPLWLHQRNVLAPYVTSERELGPEKRLPLVREPTLVYRDILYFDEFYISEFIKQAKKQKQAVRAAFLANNPAFREHALPLSTSYTPTGDLFFADLWYYPNGPVADVEPLVIDLGSTEAGYYHIPSYMAGETGDLVFQVPRKASLLAIDSWVHVFIADIVFGQFARAERRNYRANHDLLYKLKLHLTSLFEGRQFLRSSALVEVGKDCIIHPSVIINGPAKIGDRVKIEEGAVIENCIVGNDVTISQGCQMMLSVVGNGTFLPFGAKLFMTTIMENSMVAQNTCLQMCVVGRNTFIGAGTTFTDFNLIPAPLKAQNGKGELQVANCPVLGGCVGHNCRIGSGMVIYPARMIESDVVLVASNKRRVIDRDVPFEDSDHLRLRNSALHQVRYRPKEEKPEVESW